MGKQEVHNALVTRNPQFDENGVALRGGIFFNAPSLFEGEYPLPAFPCFPFASSPNGAGFFVVPKVGDEIEIIILADDPNDPYDTSDVELPEPRWRCMVYSEAADIAEEFKTNYPFRMGWKSNSGHLFVFDDAEGQEIVQLSHKIGTILKMDELGSWLETIVKDKIVSITENLTRTVGGNETNDVTGNRTETIGGFRDVTITGNDDESVGGKKTVIVTGDCEVQCAKAIITASGDADITAGGTVKVTGSSIELNGSVSGITTANSHLSVIDLITGTAVIPSTTVFSDI